MLNSPKIKRAFLDDLSKSGEKDVSLTIHLDNDQRILLNLSKNEADPRISGIAEAGQRGDPQTDGSSFFWPDGPCMSLEEIFDLLRKDSDGVITGVETYEGRSNEIDVMVADGHMLMLSLDELYVAAGQPRASGAGISWPNGATLSFDDMLAKLRSTPA
ncbi:MAG: hypothetical protein FWG48_01495 [Oscillospiraceae bacterium]|nr:hypothetical protein [Oscillospiraceae bacterium]